jgi:predicted nucleic acid-binding protein
MLNTQCFTDLASRDPDRTITRWLAETRPAGSELFVSVVSLGIVSASIEHLPAAERGAWRRLLAEARRTLLERRALLQVDLDVVDAWSTLRDLEIFEDDGDGPAPVGEDERLVIATAIARDLTLVAARVGYLDVIADATTLKLVEP